MTVRAPILAFALFACGKSTEPASTPPPATTASAPKVAPSTCTKSSECAVGHHVHPCCLEGDGSAKCFLLPPKAHGCPGREICQVDADCLPDEKCRAFDGGPVKTCQGGKGMGGPVIPGKCINRAPNAPRDPDCDNIGKDNIGK